MGRAVGARPHQGAEGIGHGQDAGVEADLVALEPVRIARAVQPLIHLADGLQHGQAEIDAGKGSPGVVHMALQLGPFLDGKRACLVQQFTGQLDHADLGQAGRRAQGRQGLGVVEAQAVGQGHGKLGREG